MPENGRESGDADEVLYVGPDAAPDRYRLMERVGVGGEGQTFKAEETFSGAPLPVAVKQAQQSDGRSIEDLETDWNQRAALLRHLDHPALVRAMESFRGALPHRADTTETAGDSVYLVQRWIDGPNLKEWVHTNYEHVGSPEVFERLASIGWALDYLHSGTDTSGVPIVHGDVKPSNIVMGSDGPILVDFGMAAAGPTTPTSRGTRGFMAPEVAVGGAVTPASDRYSYAATLYVALTGEQPPDPHDITEMERRLARTPALAGQRDSTNIFLAGLAADPMRRPPLLRPWLESLGEITDSVDPLGGGEHGDSDSTTSRMPGRIVAAFAAAGVAVVTAVIAAVFFFGRDSGDAASGDAAVEPAPAQAVSGSAGGQAPSAATSNDAKDAQSDGDRGDQQTAGPASAVTQATDGGDADSLIPGTDASDDDVGTTPAAAGDAPVADFKVTFFARRPFDAGREVEMTDESAKAPTSWAWDFGDGTTSSQQNPTHVWTQPGTYLIRLVAGNEHGSTEATYSVEVTPPRPTVQINGPNTELAGLPVTLTTVTEWAVSGAWSYDLGTGCAATSTSCANSDPRSEPWSPSDPSITITFSEGGYHFVTLNVLNSLGETATRTHVVFIG